MQEPDTQHRAIPFDFLGDQQGDVNRTDWNRRSGYNMDSEGGLDEVIGTPTFHKGQNIYSPRQRSNMFEKRPKGADRKQWRLNCHKLASADRALWIRQSLSWPRRVVH